MFNLLYTVYCAYRTLLCLITLDKKRFVDEICSWLLFWCLYSVSSSILMMSWGFSWDLVQLLAVYVALDARRHHNWLLLEQRSHELRHILCEQSTLMLLFWSISRLITLYENTRQNFFESWDKHYQSQNIQKEDEGVVLEPKKVRKIRVKKTDDVSTM